jgi:cyclic pyranopterin phosphate synthase
MARAPLQDGHGRKIADLRLSVTDRCNFRCQYCMPAEGLPWLERKEILTFEEIERIVVLLGDMGVRDLRLTGGEPLVRRDFPALAAQLCAIDALAEVSVTTNGYCSSATPRRWCAPAWTASTCRSTRSSATGSSR